MTTNYDGGAGTLPAAFQPVGAEIAPHLIISPYYRDPENGAVYVHKDLVEVRGPWQDADRKEWHIGPIKENQQFGDVASWAAYVKRFGESNGSLLTWNNSGLRAVLDYHGTTEDEKGNLVVDNNYCQWTAEHKFTLAQPLTRWVGFANGSQRGQKDVIEFLEDLAETVVQPSAAALTGILSTLRATVGQKADSTLREDGSYNVQYSKDAKLTASGTIPPTFTIRVPVLVGHTNADGSPVVYDLTVRLRVTPTELGAVFRLSIPNLSTTLEDAYADRVAAARAALGESYPILRAADTK